MVPSFYHDGFEHAVLLDFFAVVRELFFEEFFFVQRGEEDFCCYEAVACGVEVVGALVCFQECYECFLVVWLAIKPCSEWVAE